MWRIVSRFAVMSRRGSIVANGLRYGISKQIWMQNPVSISGDKVRFGLMEKLHTLSHNGTWRTANLDPRARETDGEAAVSCSR